VLVLPPSTCVLRAAADASGVYAYVYDGERGPRSLLRRRPGGRIQTLADAPRIEQLALDDERVFWVGEDGVQSVAKRGGPVQNVAPRDMSLIPPAPNATRWSLVLDGDDVYFTLDDAVGRVSKRGGPAQLLASGPGATVVGVDAAEVWWLDEEASGSSGEPTDALRATPRYGGASRRVGASMSGVLAMTADEENVYWLGETERPGRGAILRTSKSTGDVSTLVPDVPTYYGHVLALAGAGLFWLEYPSGLHGPMRVREVPRRGGAPVTLAEPFPPANKLLVDGHHAYWAQDGVRAVALPAPNADDDRGTPRQELDRSRALSPQIAVGTRGASSSNER
jgi:hypothetical protein